VGYSLAPLTGLSSHGLRRGLRMFRPGDYASK
jgi:hypothetical protein